ncbi:MAG: energy transducer TonB [Methylomonas lenta]|nr:energy transducer TonB [Methylomonas lenta]
MIANLCFLQFAAVSNRPQREPIVSQFGRLTGNQAYRTWLGIGIAAGMHLAILVLLPNETNETVITPPQPIMVNWFSAAAETKFTPPPPKSISQPDRVVKKPKPKPKPKPLPKVAKSKPVLATTNETASPQTVLKSEYEPQQLPPTTSAQPAQSVESTASATSTESEQAPLSQPSLQADYLNNPAPDYPDDSRRQGEQGRVLLRVFVNAAGVVEQVALRKSSGHPRLDQAALETVKTWRFVAARRGTEAVAAWVVVPISFSLEG